jgi:hypothetical protein
VPAIVEAVLLEHAAASVDGHSVQVVLMSEARVGLGIDNRSE